MTPRRLPPTRSGTHSIERMPSRSSTSRRAERGSVRTSSTRIADAVLGAPADDALADRQRQPPPLLALEAVGGRVDQPGARRVQQPDPAPGRADQRGHRAADAIEHGGDVQAGGDELAGREERGQLLGAAAALVEQAALLDGRGQRARQLGGDLDVRVVERRAPAARPASPRRRPRRGSPAGPAAPSCSRRSASRRRLTSGTAAALTSSTRIGSAPAASWASRV